MENTTQSLNEGLSQNTVNNLSMSARAIKMGAILALVWVGILTLNGLYSMLMNFFHGYFSIIDIVTNVLGIGSTAIFIIPILGGFKFSGRINHAILSNDQESMSQGFRALKKVGKTVFIFSIIKLGLWVIGYAWMSMDGGGYGLY
ncbi:MAG: hypothetical protein ACI9J3_001218 [Parvicellaceae bacterium]|jgi:hypothetical protein